MYKKINLDTESLEIILWIKNWVNIVTINQAERSC